MSLAPETRNLLTDALSPPLGYRMDIAVATTYSLDLPAMLLAPLTFALQDHSGDADSADPIASLEVDPIATLESVRRYADRLTIFCQGGAIYPTSYRSILTFVEDAIVEVGAPRQGAVFHPKVWAIRFANSNGEHLHRCLVLSRNLTFDNSWDTILTLDELVNDGDAGGIDGRPLGRFVSELPALSAKLLETERRRQIADLATTIGRTRFAPPAPYLSGEIIPLGLPWSEPLTLPESSRLLVVSPFLGAGALKSLAAGTREMLLLSRPRSLDVLGELKNVAGYVLDETVEQEPGTDPPGARGDDVVDETSADHVPASETTPPISGLHAKFYISARGHEAEIVTGSANATGAGFDGNVEVVVRLHGRRSSTGINSTWEGTKEAPGLSRYVTPYTPQNVDEDESVAEQNAWNIDRWHAALARSALQLTLHDVADDGTAHLTLTIPEQQPPDGCRSLVRPLSLPEQVEEHDLAPSLHWGPVSVSRVTPFLAVTTTLGRGKSVVRRSRVVKAELIGDVPERRLSALQDTLRNSDDVLRYLLFLLGDPAATGASASEQLRRTWGRSTGNAAIRSTIFEPLIRAVADGERSLDRVASFLDELEGAADDLVPSELEELWAVVNEARGTPR